MALGDVATWAGVAVSIVLGFTATYRTSASKRQAAEAVKRADEAVTAAQSMATSLEKIAENFAASPRSPTPDPEPAAFAEASADVAGNEDRLGLVWGLPAWNVEYRGGTIWALRNVGTVVATKVTIDAGTQLARDLPTEDGVTVHPGQAYQFLLLQIDEEPHPTEILVDCVELGPTHVPTPA